MKAPRQFFTGLGSSESIIWNTEVVLSARLDGSVYWRQSPENFELERAALVSLALP